MLCRYKSTEVVDRMREDMTIEETVFWGSYLTDLFKDVPEARSGRIRDALRKGEIDIDGHIRVLKEELGMLGHPVVIAFGNLVYDCLSKNLTSFKVVRLRHYSDYCSKERYREEVLGLERKISEFKMHIQC